MIKEYQVTLFCTTNQYKPVSCIIKRNQTIDEDLSKNKESKRLLINEGVKKICNKKYWSKTDVFSKYNYTKAKVRLYDKSATKAEMIKNS